jgi:hypothetical protein
MNAPRKNETVVDRRRHCAGAAIESAVSAAIRRGFQVGRAVAIGAVRGEIIGFNIAAFGRFVGTRFPLLVRTELGLAKCGPDELRLLC